MIKKIIITVLILFTIHTGVFALSTKDTLSSIENGVFGYDYRNESDTKRIERLEEYMYGVKKTGTIQSRIDALQNDSGIITEEKKPKKDAQMSAQQNNGADGNLQNGIKTPLKKQLKEDDSVEYAIVDKMEKDLFNQTYKNENIYDRLNRLENTVFQNTSNEDLSTRVDKLASVLRPSGRKMPIQEERTYTPENLGKIYNEQGFMQVDEQTLPFQLAALENDILRHEYQSDNNSNRLSRLEQKVFNRTFPNDADTQRLQRLIAAYEAKKDSYKYENNRKMQNMATMSQIGGILLMILAILL